MSFCKDCVRGVTHEGTPSGTFEEIAGVKVYVGTPTGDYPKDKVVLFLPDIFGIELINNQLLIDDFAANGFKTIGIDYFGGDAAPADGMNPGSTWDLMKWFGSHGPDVTRPYIDKVIAALKEQGVTAFGATGYCFGGRYVFNLSFDNAIQVSVVSHPSLLEVPADLEKYVSSSKSPLLINSCTVDQQFPLEASAQADKIFSDFGPGYKREYFEGCGHGFAVRGDLSDPKVKAGKEGAFKSAVHWFAKHL